MALSARAPCRHKPSRCRCIRSTSPRLCRPSWRKTPKNKVIDYTREGCARIYEETASGAKADRPELKRALDHMRAGDTLVVWKLDRLARSMKQLIETVTALEAAGVKFRSITEAIDTGSAAGKLQFHIFGALAEFERALIRERTMAGLQAARARGRKGGRRKKLSADDLMMARRLLDGDFSAKAVADRLHVNRSTLFRHLKAAEGA